MATNSVMGAISSLVDIGKWFRISLGLCEMSPGSLAPTPRHLPLAGKLLKNHSVAPDIHLLTPKAPVLHQSPISVSSIGQARLL